MPGVKELRSKKNGSYRGAAFLIFIFFRLSRPQLFDYISQILKTQIISNV